MKEGKIGRKDGQPLPGEDEPLHAYITANDPENVKKAVARVSFLLPGFVNKAFDTQLIRCWQSLGIGRRLQNILEN